MLQGKFAWRSRKNKFVWSKHEWMKTFTEKANSCHVVSFLFLQQERTFDKAWTEYFLKEPWLLLSSVEVHGRWFHPSLWCTFHHYCNWWLWTCLSVLHFCAHLHRHHTPSSGESPSETEMASHLRSWLLQEIWSRRWKVEWWWVVVQHYSRFKVVLGRVAVLNFFFDNWQYS